MVALDVHDQYVGRIEPLRAGLLSLIRHVAATRAAHDGPAPESEAHTQETTDLAYRASLGGHPALTTRLLGTLQLSSAEDHLAALCRLYALPEPVIFTDRTLLRAGVEAAARAFHLLDWRCDLRTRVARGLNERLHDHHQAHGMLEENERAEHMRERETLLIMCSQAGYKPQTPKKGAAWVLHQRPTATDVMSHLFDSGSLSVGEQSLGVVAQRYLSTFVHGTTLGLLSTMHLDQAKRHEEGSTITAPLESNTTTVNGFLAVASVAYIVSATALLRYAGWMDDSWRKQVTNQTGLVRGTIGNGAAR